VLLAILVALKHADSRLGFTGIAHISGGIALQHLQSIDWDGKSNNG
jgi:hypothetical protein